MEKLWYKSYAEGVPHTVDFEDIVLPEALARAAEKYPDTTGLIFVDTKISFRQFNDMVNRMANAFIDLGVRPGDRVAMLLPNIPQIAVATYAAWRIGGIVVMNNPLYTDTELEHQLKDSDVTVLVTLDLLAPRMLALQAKTNIK